MQLLEVHHRTVRQTERSHGAKNPDAKSRGTRDNVDHPISYLDTLIKRGRESTKATLRRKRILFAGFVACMEETRLPKFVMFGDLVGGAGCVGSEEKEWMGCLLDDLRAFDINADQWTTAAQDEGTWLKTAEQGA